MYIEGAYFFWRMSSDLMLNHDFTIIHLSEDQNEIWLEKSIKRKSYVIRIKQQTFDWANQLKQDQDSLSDKLKKIKSQLVGREIVVKNVYISEFPPVDDWEQRKEPIYLKDRKSITIYHYYITDQRTKGINQVYKDMHLQEPSFVVPSELDMEQSIYEIRRHMKRRHKDDQQQMKQVFSFGKPRLTYLFIFLSLLMFAWLEYQGGSTNTLTLIQYGAKYNPAIIEGEWWRILSSMFLHIGFLHIGMNMLALYYLGNPVERMYGSARFAFIYFVSGIVGGITSFALTPSVAAGASGAIYGLFGALLFFGVVHKKLFFQTMGPNLLWIIALNIVFSFSIPQVDMGAHIGGLVGGFLASSIVHFPKKRNIAMQLVSLVLALIIASGMVYYGVANEDNHYDPRLQAQVVQEYAQNEQYDRAIHLANETLRNTDGSAELYFSRAYAYSKKGNVDEAQEDLKTSISIRPSFALAHYNLSVIYQHKQNHQKALEHAREALELSPDDERFQKHLQSLEKSG